MFKRFWWVFLAMVPVGSIAGLFCAAVVTYVMPKTYESEAVIEVKPQAGQSAPSTTTPQFFGTEFEKIKSSNSLAKVVDNLELINRWAVDKETAIRTLKGIVTTQNIRGTDLISIRVRHTNKEDARDIAAEVARSYASYRSEIQHSSREKELLELEKAVRVQEEKVEESRKILATIPNPPLSAPVADPSSDLAIRRGGGANYADAKREFETDQALLQSMNLKLVGDKITANMGESSVVIHEEPQIADAPISPNVTLNLVLGTALGLLLSPLLSLPLIYLLSRLIPVKATP